MKAYISREILLFLILLNSLNIFADSTESVADIKKTSIIYDASWKASISNIQWENKTENANNTGFKFSTKIDAKLSHRFDAFIKGNLRWATERSQKSINSGDKSGFYLDEVYLKFSPNDNIKLMAGAIDQGHLESPLLISERSFPGLLEEVSFKNNILLGGIKASQAIPTSKSYDTVRASKEKTPTFFTETIFSTVGPFYDFKISSSVTHYRFKNLPSIVAYDSAFYGNSVIGTDSGTDSKFAFNFAGYSALLQVDYSFSSQTKFLIGFQHIQNDLAPSAYNRGRRLFTELQLGVGRDTITPRYEIFFNESDTSPGYYNSSKYAHNNRKGFMAKIKYDFNKYGYSTSIQYVDSDIIQSNLFDQHEQSISINLETMYASF